MKKQILLSVGTFEMQSLSAAEALDCLWEAKKCLEKIMPPDNSPELAKAAAENSALASFCLYREGERVFSSGYEALCRLSLSDLAEVYEQYEEGEKLENECV